MGDLVDLARPGNWTLACQAHGARNQAVHDRIHLAMQAETVVVGGVVGGGEGDSGSGLWVAVVGGGSGGIGWWWVIIEWWG